MMAATAFREPPLVSDHLPRGRAPPGYEANAGGLGVLLVRCPGGDVAGVARPVRDAVLPEDEGDGSVQHEQAGIEPVGMRLPVHIGLDLALANFVAVSSELGLELGSGHGTLPLSISRWTRGVGAPRRPECRQTPTPRRAPSRR